MSTAAACRAASALMHPCTSRPFHRCPRFLPPPTLPQPSPIPHPPGVAWSPPLENDTVFCGRPPASRTRPQGRVLRHLAAPHLGSIRGSRRRTFLPGTNDELPQFFLFFFTVILHNPAPPTPPTPWQGNASRSGRGRLPGDKDIQQRRSFHQGHHLH